MRIYEESRKKKQHWLASMDSLHEHNDITRGVMFKSKTKGRLFVSHVKIKSRHERTTFIRTHACQKKKSIKPK